MKTKASRLKDLAKVCSVPDFIILTKDNTDISSLSSDKLYMVRSSSTQEDQEQSSMAGQFTTYGPIKKNSIVKKIKKLFTDNRVNEIIIQEFVQGINGVAFVQSKKDIRVAFSNIFEGVTSGIINPSILDRSRQTAKKYDSLFAALEKIYTAFGPCDVEFINIESPAFVQVRPITKKITTTDTLAEVKMYIQELDEGNWIADEFCKILPERDEYSKSYIDLYVKTLPAFFKKYFNKLIYMPKKPFIKIGRQYYIAHSLHKQLTLGLLQTFKFSFIFAKVQKEQKDVSKLNKPEDILELNLLYSYAYELLGKKKEYFECKEACFSKLLQLLPKKTFPTDVKTTSTLIDNISYDKEQLIWKTIGIKDDTGQEVVKGIPNGPYYHFKKGTKQVPENSVMVCEQLYTELGEHLDSIGGIICEHGSTLSHIAILAREKNVPLRINETAALKKYC